MLQRYLVVLRIDGHITESGNISASGDIVANNLSGTNTGDQDLSNLVTNSSTASFAITGSDVLFGNITSSGNISASGTTNTKFLRLPEVGASSAANGSIYFGAGPDDTNGFIYGQAGTNLTLGFDTADVVQISDDVTINASLLFNNASNKIRTSGSIDAVTNITASGGISASGDIIAKKVTADVVDTSFETFLNFEAATAFTFIAPFAMTINFTGSSTSSMDTVDFVTASANTSTFSTRQGLPLTLNIFDKLKITPSSSGLFSFSGSRTI